MFPVKVYTVPFTTMGTGLSELWMLPVLEIVIIGKFTIFCEPGMTPTFGPVARIMTDDMIKAVRKKSAALTAFFMNKH